MPRLTKISEIPELNPNEHIMLVRGTITKLYPVNRGTNSLGEWTIQKGEIRDETGTIRFMANDRDYPIPDLWKGKEIIIESTQGERGYNGLLAYDDTYIPRGKPADTPPTRVLKITKTANMYLASDADDGGQQAPPPRQQAAPQQRPAPAQQRPAGNSGGQGSAPAAHQPSQQRPAQQPPPASKGDTHVEYDQPPAQKRPPADPEKEVKRAVMRDALLMGICVDASMAILSPKMIENGLTASEESLRTLAITLFIQASRRDDALKLSLPRKTAATEAAPEPPRQPPPAMTNQHPLAPGRQAYQQPDPEDDDIPF